MTDLIPERGKLTTVLFNQLLTLEDVPENPIGAGDGVAPADYGWPTGQPGVGAFKPYVVLKSQPGSQQRGRDNLSAQIDAWLFPYTITAWGSLREQADDAADLASQAIAMIDPKAYRGDNSPISGFGIQNIQITTIGSTERTDQSAPAMWSRVDSLTVWLARARGR